MVRFSSVLSIVGAVIAMPLLAMPASANVFACSTALAPAFTDTTPGGTGIGVGSGNSCTVDGLTFSLMSIVVTVTGNASVGNITVSPFATMFQGQLEEGLQLSFLATAGNSPPDGSTGSVDIAWNYTVTGNPAITDVYLGLAGGVQGTGQIGVDEVFTSTSCPSLHLLTAGTTGQNCSPPVTGPMGVIKDDFTRTALDGFAEQSVVQNGFSVPGPIAGAGLPGLVAACAGLIGMARRRRRRIV